jgi:macrodomain Ter protein organizer (MatP/YcbG family)
MATATARNVDDRDYAVLSEMAQENGRSISEELRTLIAEATRRRKVKKVVADMRALAQRNPLRLPDGMTSLDLLREERDSW